MRLRRTVLATLLALLVVPAVALAATTLTAARYEAPDGTVFRVTVSKALTDGKARFRLATTADGSTDVLTTSDMGPARKKPLRVGSSLACDDPGVSVAYGTVARAAKRVVATLVDGMKLRLSRVDPPKRWRFDGYIVAGIANSQSPVERVDVTGNSGKRLSFAKFTAPEGC